MPKQADVFVLDLNRVSHLRQGMALDTRESPKRYGKGIGARWTSQWPSVATTNVPPWRKSVQCWDDLVLDHIADVVCIAGA